MVNRNLRRALGATLQAVMLCVCGAMLAGCRGNNADRLEQAFRDAGAMLAGCRGNNADRLEQAFRDAGTSKATVAPVAGVVTIDGMVPEPFTLVMLWDPKKPGGRLGNFDGPDLLNNLYNDPDKNAADPEFQITVSEPGKSDYHFNLGIAGKPSGTPGPHAVTELRAAT
jgi:hypothetical protein